MLTKIGDPLEQPPEEYERNLKRASERAERDPDLTGNDKEEWITFHAARPDVLEAMERWETVTGLSMQEIDNLKVNELFELLRNEPSQSLQELQEISQITYPRDLISVNDLVTKTVFKGMEARELLKVRTAKNAYVKFGIIFEDDDISYSRKMNAFDKIVYKGVVSIYTESTKHEGGKVYFKLSTLHRVITTNKDTKLTRDSKMMKDIITSLEKLAGTRIEIDATQEYENTNFNIGQPIRKGNLLNIESVQCLYNGESEEFIELIKEPILYQYANEKNHITRVPMTLLNVPKLNKNMRHLLLVDFLCEEISYMKGSKGKSKERSNSITYESIYKRLEMEDASRQQKQKVRKTIQEKIIPYWKESGWVKGYKEKPDGRTIKSIIIEL